jgi:hypothetical protein
VGSYSFSYGGPNLGTGFSPEFYPNLGTEFSPEFYPNLGTDFIPDFGKPKSVCLDG